MALLSGKVAIVTGGGRGLGRCHALALAAHGASVVVNDFGGSITGEPPLQNKGSAASDVVAQITAMGGRAAANNASVADWAGAGSIIDTAMTAFGRLDIVVNNAGINRPASLIDLTEADYDLETGVHLKGTTAVCHHAARLWASQGRPKDGHDARAIINTTSPVGVHPMVNGGPYCAAKAGIAALTVVAAQELAYLGVRVNAVAPAARTRMVMASPAVGQLMPTADGFDRHLPDHVSPLVVYLACALNRFTGRIFGAEGPDVALYQPWSADWLVTGDGQWQVPALAEALAALPAQAEIRAFYPGGRINTRIPPQRSINALGG